MIEEACAGNIARHDFWSELTLVVSGLSDDSYELYMALHELEREPEIEVRRVEDLSPRQVAALTLEGREV